MRKKIISSRLSIQLVIAVAISFFASLILMAAISQYVIVNYISKMKFLNPFYINMFNFILPTSSIVVFVIVFLVLVKKKINYIKYISKQVNKIANEELGATLKVKGNDEIAELCKSINFMSKELKDKFDRERELEDTKTELITNVSHDLRTPLTSIIGYLDILIKEKFNNKEEKKDYLNSTYNLSIKLKKLIDELFDYTKLSNSNISLDFQKVDLGDILIQMLGEYSPIAESKGLRVVTDISDEKLPVKIDIEKMIRVFDNILSNAEKYSLKPSDIVVKAEGKDDNIFISISNKGVHLEQNKLNKMFEKFYRVDVSRSNNIEGSGIGLAICKKIVDLHNGQIWAKSNKDVISINIRLPKNSI
ncbi:HAMP domain-containing sensor histidine kinase [Clostridium oceanicum]|uniref:histidine kinase n=1 Tax=Clostridium oceanicum TaxID=1543 RepID=A0ABP3UTW2_9CLOT